jgi:RNA polymerase sigma-70 factor (ECF subfamily)
VDDTPKTLLARLRSPADDGAWRRFVDLFGPLVLHWAGSMGLRRHDAEEAVQDVFALLVRELPRFEYDPARSFRAWLKTVTRRAALRRKRTLRALSPIPEECPEETDPDGVEEREYRSWLLHRLWVILASDFDEVTRTVFRRYAIDGEEPAELARELGLSRNAVYLIRHRVLARLRSELKDLLP